MGRTISVLGAGSWGTALALQAARNGFDTLLWGHNPKHITEIEHDRENRRYLPGVSLPANLRLTCSLDDCPTFSDLLLIAVPSSAFRETLGGIKPHLSQNARVAWATKGFDKEGIGLLSNVARQLLGDQSPVAVLSGPTFAKEVADGLPTALTIAATSDEFAEQLSKALHNHRFRIYTSPDIIGVQVGGACKNVLAIAAGIADGLGFGANTRAALITRGLSEIMRLSAKLGGQSETLMGLAGLGDLVLTCTDNQSRNRRFGLALGQGKSRQQALTEINQSVEGIAAAKESYRLSKIHRIEMPITEQVYSVLFDDITPEQAVNNLLTRDQKPEKIDT